MPSKTYPVLAPVTCSSILIQQSPLLCFLLSANLLCVSEREHMVRVLPPPYRGYQNQRHHEHLACCPPNHDWAVLWADKSHETVQRRGTYDINCTHQDIIYIYIHMVYTWYTHGTWNVYADLTDMSGIYLVNTSWVCSVPFFIMIYLWCTMYIQRIYIVHHISCMYIHDIYHVYTWYILYIYIYSTYNVY